GRAGVHRAAEVQETAMAFYQPHHHREPETGALPRFFRGEKRIENPIDNCARDAGAGVGYHERDISARLRIRMWWRGARCKLGVARGNFEDAALRHRIARIDAEVEQYLVKLRNIAAHRP